MKKIIRSLSICKVVNMMNKFDISSWGEFKVKDLFDIHPTKAYDMNNSQLLNGGDNPVLANSRYNNGVGGYSTMDNTETGNMITFSDTVDANTIFYQDNPFIGYSHVQGLYEKGKYKGKWTKNALLFFMIIFKQAAKTKGFNYDVKFRRDVALELSVYLPIDKDGDPDWSFMENYIVTIENKAQRKVDTLRNIEGNQTVIDTTKWKRFCLYDERLFIIDSGNKLDKSKMTSNNPKINFVGRSSVNNGVTGIVDSIEGEKAYKSGNMTLALGGEHLGSCFVQEKDFYTSQNVNVLIPRNEMSLNVKLFISFIIYRESRTYYKAFEDELNRHIKTDFSILLPVDQDGNPDWKYMEKCVENIQTSSQSKIDSFKTLLLQNNYSTNC